MPHTAEEEGKESPPTRSPFSITAWWRKFHFSGRVIACSVLLGLGLVLIGGLIFAINLADDNDTPDTDGNTGKMPTKAPSNYTGPVVMGIGGFIVVTGVIMCLFETQVCRKRTGDSSPLIPDKADDPERRGSDPAPGPSTSNGHKSHRHGARKTCASPKKSKGRRVKSKSKERNQQKSPSPKTPPVPIQPSRSFMTSSEDNFLTPPNTLNENAAAVAKNESRNSGAKHSALMKSFTSSDPSWNQSAEFLTPSTSFRDSSVSLNNSVEIEVHDERNTKATELSEKQVLNSEYMTPLTVEEDRIQQLLMRVKNEQQQITDSNKETNVGASESSKQNIVKVVEAEKNFAGENSSTGNLLPESTTTSKDVNQDPNDHMENANSQELSQSKCETVVSEKNLIDVHNEAHDKITEEITNASESKNLAPVDTQQGKISSQCDSTSFTNENKNPTLAPDSGKDASHSSVQEKKEQVDLESSASSDETVVSPDSFQENPINVPSSEKPVLSTLKEDSDDESKSAHPDTLESPENNTNAVDIDEGNHHITHENLPHQDEAEAQDLSLNENDSPELVADDTENASNVSS